ncbi:MAG: carboxypeptidase regulatory-like domain-containing protein [Actinobacteria bacterium]|nr:carboxypeptidase regulatory-like domain-containing protein [Actinomycetota bacterium]
MGSSQITRLSGRVTVHGGDPAVAAVIEVSNSHGDIIDQVQVDDEGSYRYYLSPGSWSLRAWNAHGQRASKTVTLQENGEETLDIDLT